MVKTMVKNEVFPLFSEGKFNEGIQKLKEFASLLDKKSDTEDKRMVFYNLSVAHRVINKKKLAKFYIMECKNILESDEEYINNPNNIGKYTDVLIMYMDYYKEHYDKEIKIKIYEDNSIFYSKTIDTIERALMSKSSLALLNDDYEEMQEIVHMIHNYKISYKDNSNLISKLTFVENEIMNDLRKNSKFHYEEMVEILKANSLV